MLTPWQQGDWDVECQDEGGRLTRVRWGGRDLLTRPHLPGGQFRRPAPRWGEYETRPVFGYDDCWPSLEVSAWPQREQRVRDHGELCWRRWTVDKQGGAMLATASEPGDWTFTRGLRCDEGVLRFDFTVTNEGQRPLAMGWAGHCLVPPGDVRGLVLPGYQTASWAWPPDPSRDRPADAQGVWSVLSALPRGTAVMLVLGHCHPPSFTVALDGLSWRVAIEGVVRPALGLWYNRAGYPPEAGLEREEFGLEWMLTAECVLQDAAASGSAIALAPGQALRWAITWSMEETP